MVSFDNLNAGIAALAAQVAQTEGTESSAAVLIRGFGAAVTKAVADALTADAAANQGSIDAATAAINDTVGKFTASAADLGAAVAENPGA